MTTTDQGTAAEAGTTAPPDLTVSTAPAAEAPDGTGPGADGEAEQLLADGLARLRTLTDGRAEGAVYISTVNVESIAGRDIHNNGDRRPGRPGRARPGEDDEAPRVVGVVGVSAAELDRLRAVTLTVDTRRHAAPVLDEERLLVLRGPAGAGKRAAAIDLLQEYGSVLDIDPSVSLPALADFTTRIRRPDYACYVVESLAADTARVLNDYTVRALTRQLADTGSRLVLTIDERVPLQSEVNACAVTWRERPDPVEALRRHLAYHLTPALADDVLARLPLAELERQLADREMRLIDRLARDVAQAYKDGADVATAVHNLGLDARERVSQWFAEERSPLDVAFLLAATVLSGCTFASVATHASRIEALLASLCRIDLDDQPQRPTRCNTDLLAKAMARTTQGMLTTEFGTCVTRLVELESDALFSAVLDVVWHEHDLAAEALVRWLVEAGVDPDGDVRLRAALAAGQLADFEFATVRSRILLPWARHPSKLAGWAAADALGVPAGKEGTAPLALGLLHHWAGVSDFNMAWTAAVAFGGYVGLEWPTIAMHELCGIAIRHGPPLWPTVHAAVVRLLGLGALAGGDVPTVVLTGLTDWLHKDLEPAGAQARNIAVRLLRIAGDPADGRAARIRDRLVRNDVLPVTGLLLRSALREKASRDAAVDAVLGLVDAADRDASAYPALERLLLAAVTGPDTNERDAQRVRHSLTPWTQGPDPSRTAVQLLDRLPKG